MFKYIVFAVLLAFAAAEPKPAPKPGYLAAPLAYTSGAYLSPYTASSYISPYSAYTAPLAYSDSYRYNYAYPYAYNAYY